jgi:hypothetical protein
LSIWCEKEQKIHVTGEDTGGGITAGCAVDDGIKVKAPCSFFGSIYDNDKTGTIMSALQQDLLTMGLYKLHKVVDGGYGDCRTADHGDLEAVNGCFGNNYRMNKVQVAAGCAQLKKLDGLMQKRRKNSRIESKRA